MRRYTVHGVRCKALIGIHLLPVSFSVVLSLWLPPPAADRSQIAIAIDDASGLEPITIPIPILYFLCVLRALYIEKK